MSRSAVELRTPLLLTVKGMVREKVATNSLTRPDYLAQNHQSSETFCSALIPKCGRSAPCVAAIQVFAELSLLLICTPLPMSLSDKPRLWKRRSYLFYDIEHFIDQLTFSISSSIVIIVIFQGIERRGDHVRER